MDENQDSEPLFNDADYQLLRNDSFLTRLGSNNFASLIETPAHPSHEDENVSQLQQHQPQPLQQPPQQEQMPDIQFLHDPDIGDSLFTSNGILTLQQGDLLDPAEYWNNMETVETTNQCVQLKPEAPLAIVDGITSTSTPCNPDSTPTQVVPSLQPWPGQYDFQISLPLENKDRNKWCFSPGRNKLYLCPNVAVPVNMKLLQFIDASITITPVFKESRHRVQPVIPCFNCKSKVISDVKDHLVMVEGQECDYKVVNERYVVSVPLHPPPPGEAVSTLLVRLICLTSCVGGPNRRPFCLVFTLHDNTGTVIGRQILDLKCCKCPSRDMLHEDKAAARHQERPVQSHIPVNPVQGLKRAAPVTTTGEKKKRINVKLEPGTERRYINVPVPTEYEAKVKRYINSLIAADYVRRNAPNLLLFPEDEH